MITKIISGGQTGADRAALQFAIDNWIHHGGWCPSGRLAEDGPIPRNFNLTETKSDKYPPRTELNVQMSDATIIFNQSYSFERGCTLTHNLCKKHEKPCLVLIKHETNPEVNAGVIENFIKGNNIKILNIAGNRESKAPGMFEYVLQVLNLVNKIYFDIHKNVISTLLNKN